MTDHPRRNVAASVRQRLMNAAKASGRPFQEVLQYYAMERFLYRLSQSPHRDRFILKGALMFNIWGALASRPTRDIDLLAHMNNDVDAIVPVMRDICRQEVEPDGLTFDVDSVTGEVIKEEADYSGVRVTFLGFLQNARIAMQTDIGFGDVVEPAAHLTDYPTILELAGPRLRAYPRETVVAEKYQAMVKLGQLNSRMKDFFDLWMLSRQFAFDGPSLAKAVSRTFANRHTKMNPNPVAFTLEFAGDTVKQTQWRGFLRKSRLEIAPSDLVEAITSIREFLVPLTEALVAGQPFDMHWEPPGPWRARP
ncbi:MAG: hypothetical protein KatS3mg105_5219 [Gemmatales bacterium]|nr:MAG: hypothetical protein KatS3mg105_5219 [Gemmatales bacterium]GIW99818.1 MAG: hypothetical protein KatS3mg111_3151 [Pirellulaceae bacterium]